MSIERVLVVDDLRSSAETLALFFELEGYEVEAAFNGKEAVEKFSTFKPCLILMDIGMPLMDGYEAARAIRALPSGGEVKLVALTGWSREEDRLRVEEAGFDRHVCKPVAPDALRNLLAEL